MLQLYIMLYHQTKSSCKRISHIFYYMRHHCDFDLDNTPLFSSSFFYNSHCFFSLTLRHSSSWWCTTIPCLVTNGSKVQKIWHTLFGYKWFKGSEDMTYPVWLQMVQRFRRYDIPCLVTNGSKVQKTWHTLFGYKWFKGSEDMTYPVWLQMVQRFRRHDIPCLVTNGSKVQKIWHTLFGYKRFKGYDIPCLVTNGSKVQKIWHTLFGYKWFKGSEDMT